MDRTDAQDLLMDCRIGSILVAMAEVYLQPDLTTQDTPLARY